MSNEENAKQEENVQQEENVKQAVDSAKNTAGNLVSSFLGLKEYRPFLIQLATTNRHRYAGKFSRT